jgi:uncharacterized protein
MEWSIYNHLYYSKKIKSYLLYSSLSNILIELNKKDYDTILQIKTDPELIDLKDEQNNLLIDGRFLVESNINEINKLVLSTLTKRFNRSLLSLTIAPTRACNFNCPYCYEKDRANKRMSQRVQKEIINFVKKYNEVDSLSVVWYGGEPSLETNIIKNLSIELKKLVKNYNAYMITNGFCLDKLIDSIEKLYVNGLQITLDGTKETHNQTRHLKNGDGTFDKILSNIDALLARYHNLNIAIRMNINKANSDQYVPLHYFLRERFGRKVHLYPAFVRDYGGGCISGSCYEDSKKKAAFLKKSTKSQGYIQKIYILKEHLKVVCVNK